MLRLQRDLMRLIHPPSLLLLLVLALAPGTVSYCSDFGVSHDGKRSTLRGSLLFAPSFEIGWRFKSVKSLTPVRSGPPSWVPWPGTNSPIIDTDKELLLKRERCKLCRGTGLTSCRTCQGKGHIRGHSRRYHLPNLVEFHAGH